MVRVSDAHPGYAPVVGRAGDAECGSRAQNEASSDIDCVRGPLLRTHNGREVAHQPADGAMPGTSLRRRGLWCLLAVLDIDTGSTCHGR